MGSGVFGDVVLFGDDGNLLFTFLSTGRDFDFGDAVDFGGESFSHVLFASDANDASDGAFIGGGVTSAESGCAQEGEGGKEKGELFHVCGLGFG